jgi:hypothetical protein
VVIAVSIAVQQYTIHAHLELPLRAYIAVCIVSQASKSSAVHTARQTARKVLCTMQSILPVPVAKAAEACTHSVHTTAHIRACRTIYTLFTKLHIKDRSSATRKQTLYTNFYTYSISIEYKHRVQAHGIYLRFCLFLSARVSLPLSFLRTTPLSTSPSDSSSLESELSSCVQRLING